MTLARIHHPDKRFAIYGRELGADAYVYVLRATWHTTFTVFAEMRGREVIDLPGIATLTEAMRHARAASAALQWRIRKRG